MEHDFAIVYFGLTRSTKTVYTSHIERVHNVLKSAGLSYKIFMHTWKTRNNKQKVWGTVCEKEIDYTEYKLLNPDFYKIDMQDDFIESLDMNNYFYKSVWDSKRESGQGEWKPELIKNHLCALESMKRGLCMVEDYMKIGHRFTSILFIRPDVFIENNLPIAQLVPDTISIPNFDHFEGYNDRFAIMNYAIAIQYGKRIDEIADFRKHNGRIVSEKYVKFIVNKYKIPVTLIDFKFKIIRH